MLTLVVVLAGCLNTPENSAFTETPTPYRNIGDLTEVNNTLAYIARTDNASRTFSESGGDIVVYNGTEYGAEYDAITQIIEVNNTLLFKTSSV